LLNLSTISVEGVIGYPALNRAPAANAPSQAAASPFMKCVPVSTPTGSAVALAGNFGLLNFLVRIAVTIDGEIRTIHATEVATGTFVRVYHVGRVIALAVECA
jgi:hypothetical protein